MLVREYGVEVKSINKSRDLRYSVMTIVYNIVLNIGQLIRG